MVGRRSAREARATRARIVELGVEQASAVGLTGLTIGPLASAAQMSKAGVVGPFGSGDGLRLAILDGAVGRFVADVVTPTADHDAGLPRLRALLDGWVDYLAHGPFVHGCFITATSCEMTGQPGPLLDRTVEVVQSWRDLLDHQVRAAVARGELAPSVDSQRVISTLVGLSMACNQEIHLLGDATAATRARTSMHRVVDEHLTSRGESVHLQ